jgi:uncharacterized protein (DUF3084 family)
MASLTGNFIKDTYQSLLKIIDNGNVTESAKEITDGEGNSLGVSVDTSGNVTATGTIQGSTVTNGTTSISDLQTNKEDKSEKGVASGYAPLDSNSKVPTANLPDSVLGQLEYKGTWNADTDTPSLPSASTVKGNYYVVSTAGVYETIDYEIGDWIVSNGTAWEKVDNSDKVSSVNGATGAVVLDTDNIDEGTTNQYYTSSRANSDFDTRLATKDTGNLAEGSNLYYTEDRVSANTDVAANTAKTGITEAQANAIVANTDKNSYPSADALKLSGIEEGAEVNVQSNWNATSGDALILNKPSIPSSTSDLSDVASTAPQDNQVLVYNSTEEEYQPTTLSAANPVTSVNTQTGAVELDTDDIDEGDNNLYYTEARVSANTDVVANAANISTNASNIASNDTDISSLQTDVSTNTTNIATNVSDISTNGTSIATNATNIATNTSSISSNNTDIATNAGNIATNTSDISTNTSAIATNTGNISTNASGVSTNANNISSNDTDIATNASNISSNTSSISTNATNIATNVTNIASNTSDISTNTSSIATNATDIATNTGNISTNATNISSNTTDIATNATGISTNASAISTNTGNISTNTTDIATNASGISTNASDISTNATNIATNAANIPTNNNQLTNGAGYITDGNTGWDNSYGFITASTTDTLTNKSGNNSQWTNDAGYINESAQTIHTNAIGNAIDFSARVTLDGGVAEGTSGIIKNLQNIL